MEYKRPDFLNVKNIDLSKEDNENKNNKIENIENIDYNNHFFKNKCDQIETTEQINNIIIHRTNNKITFSSTSEVFKEIISRFFDNYKNNPLRAESIAKFSNA